MHIESFNKLFRAWQSNNRKILDAFAEEGLTLFSDAGNFLMRVCINTAFADGILEEKWLDIESDHTKKYSALDKPYIDLYPIKIVNVHNLLFHLRD